MMFATLVLALILPQSPSVWPPARSPAIPAADGFVEIPGAAVPPARGQSYRAVFDATRSAGQPNQILPAVNMLGSELNAFEVAGVPPSNVHLAMVFHGDALDGILDDAHYTAKHHVANPNLPVLRQLRARGVELFVCGQNLAFAHVDPATLSPDVAVASDALIVLIAYQNRGYALVSF
jgi:intracellular sulfur oxidation DsrE/DsrF family protein